MKAAEIVQLFHSKFEGTPLIFIAPGRINLIGEHTDYNDGFVMPAAIDAHITFAVRPNNSNVFRFFASDFKEMASFDQHSLQPGGEWIHYLMGVVAGLSKQGRTPGGVDCVFGSTIPVGAGLSSSAALCCGFGYALSNLFGFGLDRLTLAKIAQYSEHEFAGVRCGLMDQYASLFGVKNSALLLDCQKLSHEVLPVELGEYAILLIDTKVKHSLASTAYNDRRAACEQGVRIIQQRHPNVHSLRDANRVMLDAQQDEMGEEVYTKCRFVVEEITRTQHAARLLKSGDVEAFGRLLNETHWGLSRDYEVSCQELDFLVMLAEDDRDSFLGARMMGGGFGGCTINLVRKSRIDFIKGFVHEKYLATFRKEPDFYLVDLADGVHQE